MLDAFLSSEVRPRDVLIFGLQTPGISEPFSVGNLTIHPDFNLRTYLEGYPVDDVGFIVGSEVTFGRCQPRSGPRPYLFTPRLEDDCLGPFRLFKAGWLAAVGVMPIIESGGIEIRGELGISEQPFGQNWAEPMHYAVAADEIPAIQRIYEDLLSIPQGYLELALRRFGRSYEYYSHCEHVGLSELDDCIVDLVIALESVTSRGGDSIRQSMALRTALLVGDTLDERMNVEQMVKRFYDLRSKIVHGGQRDTISDKEHEERFIMAEALRSLARKAIDASIRILISSAPEFAVSHSRPKPMAELIDQHLFRTLHA
ncbi:MAG: hypothetical protein ACOC6F_03155 [bacterium]